MATKTELEAELDSLKTEYMAFRKDVVTKAMNAANRHGWCDVVSKTLVNMGLEDLMPRRFEVQAQYDKGDRWETDEDGFRTAKSAFNGARKAQKQSIAIQKRDHEWNWRNSNGYSYNSNITLNLNATDIESQLNQIRDMVKARTAEMPEFVPSEWPKYRAVEVSASGKLVRVIEESDIND